MSYYNELKSKNDIIKIANALASMAPSPEIHGREIVPAMAAAAVNAW